MTLDEKIRKFYILNNQMHYHRTQEGRYALKMLREDITNTYLQGNPKKFILEYTNYRLKLYCATTENLGDESLR